MKTRGERLPSIRRTLTIFAMPVSPARILEDLSPFYRQEEFPVLLHQCETWAESRPLEGCRVIDASPYSGIPAPNTPPCWRRERS